MRRELFIHFSFCFFFFVLVCIINSYFSFSYWPFWFGSLIGVFLPDLDHVIYVLFMSPQELTSQRISLLLKERSFNRIISLLYETRRERRGLVFHTVFFQIIFLVLTFWVITSSTSFLTKGLVLSFCVHLLTDQIMDIIELKDFGNWMKFSPITFDLPKAKIYVLTTGILVLIFGFLV